MKHYFSAVVLYSFLGYVWIIFIDHILGVVKGIDNFFIEVMLISVFITIFFEMANRIAPYHQYKRLHPLKITGYTSFVLIILIHFYGIPLI